jgi:hypothetical protein
MKTHTFDEPGRPRRAAGGLTHWPRALWSFAFLFLLTSAGLRAQTFTPVISQIIPAEDNSTYFDHDGDLPAVILIKNNGSVPGTISGWWLTDTTATPEKWQIPTQGAQGGARTLGAGETLIVFASAKNRTTDPLATNFLLPCGSTGYLYNPQLVQASQKDVAGENCPECIDLITPNSISAWLVPSVNNPSGTAGDWRLPAFNDASWSRGQPCLGYDQDPISQNMVLYSVFDTGTVDAVSRTITDVSGPVLHTGQWPTAAAPPVTVPSGVNPKVIQNIAFVGPTNTLSYVQYGHHAELDPGAGGYTWSIWVRPGNTDLQSSELILRKGMDSATSNAGYTLVHTPTHSATMSLLMPGFATVTATIPGGANGVVPNAWHHILCTVTRGSTNTLAIYHNGALKGSAGIPAGMNINTSLPMYLARAVSGGGPGMFQGRMDDYATWNRALTATEITRVFEAGNSGKRIDDPTAPGASPAIYGPCIQTNVQTAMKGVNTSLYERIAFTAPSAASIKSMTLRVKYDDGFIAYINGVEIARRNAPTSAPVWNMAASSDRPDASALVVEEIPVPTAGINALTSGTNILAIHALNFTANDQRFLICPELCYDELGPEDCLVSTNGRLFWITFPGNAPEDITTPLQLGVCITGANGTTGNVSIPGINPPFSQNFTIGASGKAEIALPKAASLEKSDLVENKGVRITASANVAVTGRNRVDYSTDTFLAHPIKCLGSSYITLGWSNSWTGLPDLNGSQFGIVAVANNTNVTIKPKVSTGSHPAGVPYNFVLNAGQTYLLRNTSDSPADLTGTEITSDSPVAVFAGHRCANVTGSLFFCNNVVEQILPVAFWNTEFVGAPLATRTGTELYRVIASENSTGISINGIPILPLLNKGDVRSVTVASGSGAVFTSTKKFLATHMSRSSDADDVDNSDPFQLNCQPTASWLSGYRFCTPLAAEFPARYANILARSGEIAGVTISPAPAALGAVTAIGATGFSYRQVTLNPSTVYTTSGRTHGIEIYGWDIYDAFGHSGGMVFNDTMPPVIAQCPPDMTLYTTFVAGAGERATVPDFKTALGIYDACCPNDRISVVQTPSPGTLLPVGDYPATVQATDCNGNTISCAFTLHVRTDPRQQAFPAQFGNPATEGTIWGWTADPDKDGITNEQEYLLGTSMTTCSSMHEAVTFIDRGPNASTDVRLRLRADDPSLDYTPEGSFDLNGWFGGYGHFTEVSSVPSGLPGYNFVTLRLTEWDGSRRFFLRIQMRRN